MVGLHYLRGTPLFACIVLACVFWFVSCQHLFTPSSPRSSREKILRNTTCEGLSTSKMVASSAIIMELAFLTFFGKSVPAGTDHPPLTTGSDFNSIGLCDCDSNRDHVSVKVSMACLSKKLPIYPSTFSSIDPSGCSLSGYLLFESAHVISLICIRNFQNM